MLLILILYVHLDHGTPELVHQSIAAGEFPQLRQSLLHLRGQLLAASFQNSSLTVPSLLASKPAVAGLCVGIAVICLLTAGFIIYCVKYHKKRASKPPAVSTPVPPSSTAQSSKLLPSTQQLNQRHRHPFRDDISNDSSRSLRQSPLSRTPLKEAAAQPGQVVEFPMIKYQHTSSSISAYNSLRRISAKEVTEGAVGPIDFGGFESQSQALERSLSISESQASNLESSSRTGNQTLLSSTPQPVSLAANRRPLPTPPHPPPAYEAASNTVPGPLSPLRALASHARALAFPPGNPSGSPHSLASSLHLNTTPQPFKSVSTVSITQASRMKFAHTINLETGEQSSHPQPTDVNGAQSQSEPAATRNSSIDQPILSHQMTVPGSPLSNAENNPFSNSRYELPAWLSSDPFPHQAPKHPVSQSSLCGGQARSVAASSCVLPSDSSIRIRTPEPTSPRALSPVLPTLPSTMPLSTATSNDVSPGAVEGNGPPAEDLMIQHGAERPAWAKMGGPLDLSASHSIQRVPVDGFEANESHPIRLSRTLSSGPIKGDNTNFGPLGMPNGGGVRGSTFLSLTPLSDATASGRGLYRNLSIDSPRRPIPRSNGTALSRARSFGVESPSFPDRPFTNSALGSGRDLSGYEELGWLDMNSGPGIGLRETSLAASSDVLPGDVGSIRSISPELGYIPTGGSVEGHNPTGGDILKDDKADTAAINIDVQDTGRISRLSISEAGILWGRLTAVMEAQEHSPSVKAPK